MIRLILAVVYDSNVTEWFTSGICHTFRDWPSSGC